ncbi:MAG: alpha/beta hydrolase-fold protein [Sphingobacteriales bacterium]
MKFNLVKLFLIACISFAFTSAFSQSKFPLLSLPDNSQDAISRIAQNDAINADSTYKLLHNWSYYPAIEKIDREYLYYYTDSIFGKIPLRVYIPSNYKNTEKSPCVLMLHGATTLGTFTGIDSLETFDPPVIFSTLKKQNYIIVRPISDNGKRFGWAVNKFSKTNNAPNPTYRVITQILVSLKRILNIDDNRVFALGHSDGSDGSISMGVYAPDQFAGFVAYNSMLNALFARDFYIRNIINRPAYIVHSDLDKLRPIQTTRIIVDSLCKIDDKLYYKEYIGYQHEDKHIDKDIRYAIAFLNSQVRNSFQSHIYWETNRGDLYNSCDWLNITGVDVYWGPAAWYKVLNFDTGYHGLLYYSGLQRSATVKAFYLNNTFNIETSQATEVEIKLSPVMVNFEQPVTISINGKQAFNTKITPDKNFLIENFKRTFDRQALWVNSIKLKVTQ